MIWDKPFLVNIAKILSRIVLISIILYVILFILSILYLLLFIGYYRFSKVYEHYLPGVRLNILTDVGVELYIDDKLVAITEPKMDDDCYHYVYFNRGKKHRNPLRIGDDSCLILKRGVYKFTVKKSGCESETEMFILKDLEKEHRESLFPEICNNI